MAEKVVGYVTWYYARSKGVLSLHEYRTKKLTPFHKHLHDTHGGETRETCGCSSVCGIGMEFMGSVVYPSDERHEAARKRAKQERMERLAAKAREQQADPEYVARRERIMRRIASVA